MALFPKTLPRAAVRKAIALEKNKGKIHDQQEEKASFKGNYLKDRLIYFAPIALIISPKI